MNQQKCMLYGGRRLYQYNKRQHFYISFIVNKLFSNYKLTSNQKKTSFFINNFSLFPRFEYSCCYKS